MKKKKIKTPNLEKYLEGKVHNYMTYEEGARVYSLPYWTFVNLAKEAKATKKLRKTAMVDVNILEVYLDENCNELQSERKMNMPKNRNEVENIEELIKYNKKKYVRYAEGAALYSMGMHTFREVAKDAGAIRRVKRIVLVNTEKIDAFLETFEEEEY